MVILQQIVSGITSGSLYVLLALGVSLLFRTLAVVNFAYGEMFMLGSFIGLILYSWVGLPFPIVFVLTLILSGLLGVIIERIAYRRLYKQHYYVLLVATMGISVLLRSGATVVFGTVPQAFPAIFGDTPFVIGGIVFVPQNLVILLIATIMAILLRGFLKTDFGTAMRATAQSKDAASLMGINTLHTTTATWAISSALGGIAGLLMSPIFFVSTTVGTTILIKGFAAAVLGGIGNLTGAIFGGMALGIIENIGAYFISSTWKDGISFTVMLLVLMFKPAGLFSKKPTDVEKV